jgi:hypothetical protein
MYNWKDIVTKNMLLCAVSKRLALQMLGGDYEI